MAKQAEGSRIARSCLVGWRWTKIFLFFLSNPLACVIAHAGKHARCLAARLASLDMVLTPFRIVATAFVNICSSHQSKWNELTNVPIPEPNSEVVETACVRAGADNRKHFRVAAPIPGRCEHDLPTCHASALRNVSIFHRLSLLPLTATLSACRSVTGPAIGVSISLFLGTVTFIIRYSFTLPSSWCRVSVGHLYTIYFYIRIYRIFLFLFFLFSCHYITPVSTWYLSSYRGRSFLLGLRRTWPISGSVIK